MEERYLIPEQSQFKQFRHSEFPFYYPAASSGNQYYRQPNPPVTQPSFLFYLLCFSGLRAPALLLPAAVALQRGLCRLQSIQRIPLG